MEKFLIPLEPRYEGYVPSEDECFKWWDEYEMMENIKAHSLVVANVALEIATLLKKKGYNIDFNLVKITGLLHDIAKTYTIKNGGYHSQLGAVWMLERTKNYSIAQGIIHHVYWPGPIDFKRFWLPLIIVYSDKRVKHDKVVSLKERQKYILNRYGKSYDRMQRILYSFEQASIIEKKLTKLTGVNLNAHTFNSRGMVI